MQGMSRPSVCPTIYSDLHNEFKLNTVLMAYTNCRMNSVLALISPCLRVTQAEGFQYSGADMVIH